MRWSARIVAFLLCGSAGVVASCGLEPDPTATAPPSPSGGERSTAPETALDRETALAAAVDVRAQGCGPRVGFGTGAFVDPDLVVTAAHVVAGSSGVSVIDASGDDSLAEVVLFDPDLDLALLRLGAPAGRPIGLRAARAAVGDRGIVVLPRSSTGDDDERIVDVEVVDVEVLRTVNISTTDIYREGDVDRPGFEIEATIGRGDSGAVVVLPGGGAGIVWARSRRTDRRAWAIDLPAIVTDVSRRAELQDPVDVGRCID